MSEFMELLPFLLPLAIAEIVLLGYTIYHILTHKNYKRGNRICFTITYGYNEYFWDNSIANNLFFSATMWWIFGVWVICLITLFSSLLKNNTGVSLCIGGTVLLAYLLSIIPKAKWYSPTILMNTNSLLMGVEEIDAYIKAIVITVFLCIVCVAVSIPIINKRQL